jgi:hypothetical protein
MHRWAERDGTYDDLVAQRSQALAMLPSREGRPPSPHHRGRMDPPGPQDQQRAALGLSRRHPTCRLDVAAMWWALEEVGAREEVRPPHHWASRCRPTTRPRPTFTRVAPECRPVIRLGGGTSAAADRADSEGRGPAEAGDRRGTVSSPGRRPQRGAIRRVGRPAVPSRSDGGTAHWVDGVLPGGAQARGRDTRGVQGASCGNVTRQWRWGRPRATAAT